MRSKRSMRSRTGGETRLARFDAFLSIWYDPSVAVADPRSLLTRESKGALAPRAPDQRTKVGPVDQIRTRAQPHRLRPRPSKGAPAPRAPEQRTKVGPVAQIRPRSQRHRLGRRPDRHPHSVDQPAHRAPQGPQEGPP